MERDVVTLLTSGTVCADHKQEFTEGGGLRMVKDGNTSVTYVLEVDHYALHRMARKAYRNKHGRSVLGPFTVRIVKRQKMEVKQDGR